MTTRSFSITGNFGFYNDKGLFFVYDGKIFGLSKNFTRDTRLISEQEQQRIKQFFKLMVKDNENVDGKIQRIINKRRFFDEVDENIFLVDAVDMKDVLSI
jgi:hypothetical protein